jgi:phage terminase large subunit-like protein
MSDLLMLSKEAMTGKEIEKMRGRLLDDFSYFAQLLTDPSFYDDVFHTELCRFLQHSKKDKLVVLPRTYLKTTIAGSLYALWRATKDPTMRILITSNTTPNAQKTIRTIRSIVEQNQLYHLFFPDKVPIFNKVRWSDSCACLTRPVDHPEGTFEAAGIGTNIIRRHFNLIIEDDTVAPKKDELTGEEAMPSKDDIEKAVGFHKLTIPLLINEEDERIVIGTRWASYDLINFVMENEKFDTYDRPCLREDGTPLYKKFSQKRLDDIRAGMGVYMFSMLYQNKPLAKEFMAFNPDWYRYYEEEELPEEGVGLVTVDPADPPTGKASQDYSAIVSVLHTKKGLFVRRYVRQRMSDKQMIDATFDTADKDGITKIRIETNRYAHLAAAFKEAMKIKNKYYNIDEVKAKRINKEARIKNRLSPLFENGVVFMKRGMRELEQELTTFPYGRHDDLIDALSWQVGERTSTEYEKEKYVRPPLPTADRRVFTLDEIRASCRQRYRAPYPFSRQTETVMSGHN